METRVFMHTSIFVIIYLDKNNFVFAQSTFCDTFWTILSKILFSFLGKLSFLGYKVGKLIFTSPVSV